MKLPRDLSGRDLVKALGVLGYEPTRQTGSHIRITTAINGTHHVTVPDHKILPIGTLRSILREVSRHHGLVIAELVERLFGVV
jgi:predicted RNA binding protein YcfA (HicA-like mRNA interferase family)